jgi:hypothetical protein
MRLKEKKSNKKGIQSKTNNNENIVNQILYKHKKIK